MEEIGYYLKMKTNDLYNKNLGINNELLLEYNTIISKNDKYISINDIILFKKIRSSRCRASKPFIDINSYFLLYPTRNEEMKTFNDYFIYRIRINGGNGSGIGRENKKHMIHNMKEFHTYSIKQYMYKCKNEIKEYNKQLWSINDKNRKQIEENYKLNQKHAMKIKNNVSINNEIANLHQNYKKSLKNEKKDRIVRQLENKKVISELMAIRNNLYPYLNKM